VTRTETGEFGSAWVNSFGGSHGCPEFRQSSSFGGKSWMSRVPQSSLGCPEFLRVPPPEFLPEFLQSSHRVPILQKSKKPLKTA